jgi:aminomethyltransferase
MNESSSLRPPNAIKDPTPPAAEAPVLRETPLHAQHLALGARMVPFAGWHMPLHYGSILEEHRATRAAAGLFDLSHMGEFQVSGADAFTLVNTLLTNDITDLPTSHALYSPICRDDGTIVDDIIVYHLPGLARARYLLVVNAANVQRDWEWLRHLRDQEGLTTGTLIEDHSPDSALIALQGPRAASILQQMTNEPLASIPFFGLATGVVGGLAVTIARTGYTGENGFELLVSTDQAANLWNLLRTAGTDHGLLPAGLGARDTLRLEARLPLYGADLSDQTTPLEAGLGRFVKLEKPHFSGRDALLRQHDEGPRRKLVGLSMKAQAIPRPHHVVTDAEGNRLGEVTSGTYSPTLGRGIALAYLPADQSAIGTPVRVIVRDRPQPATVVKTPFYRRPV